MYVTALLYSNIYFMVLTFTPSSFRAKIYYSSARNYFFLHNFVHCFLLKLDVLVCYYKHNYGQMVQNRPHWMVRHPKQKQVQFDWLRSVVLRCRTLLLYPAREFFALCYVSASKSQKLFQSFCILPATNY